MTRGLRISSWTTKSSYPLKTASGGTSGNGTTTSSVTVRSACLRVARRLGRSLERTGGDPGSGFEALEAGDLIFELVNALFELQDALLLEGDDVEQLPHQRR